MWKPIEPEIQQKWHIVKTIIIITKIAAAVAATKTKKVIRAKRSSSSIVKSEHVCRVTTTWPVIKHTRVYYYNGWQGCNCTCIVHNWSLWTRRKRVYNHLYTRDRTERSTPSHVSSYKCILFYFIQVHTLRTVWRT